MRICLLCLVLLAAFACQKPLWKKQVKGFNKSKTDEFWYQWYGKNPDAPKPKVGEQVHIDYQIYKRDTLLATSYDQSAPVLVEIPPDELDNLFTKALKMLATGDSLVVKVMAEEVPDLLGEYGQRFAPQELVTFCYKMHHIKDRASWQAAIKAQKQKLDSIRKAIPAFIKKYHQSPSQVGLSSTTNGLLYKIYEAGKGASVSYGDNVSVHYICFNTDGLIIDDSFSNMVPLDFEVGTPALIDGFSEGARLLKQEGKALLAVPPKLGYGKPGSGPLIPPNSMVFFYLELIRIH